MDTNDRKIMPGDRVKLIDMHQENPSRMHKGLCGTYKYTDDAGQIHISWDNGSTLALIEDVDKFEWIS